MSTIWFILFYFAYIIHVGVNVGVMNHSPKLGEHKAIKRVDYEDLDFGSFRNFDIISSLIENLPSKKHPNFDGVSKN